MGKRKHIYASPFLMYLYLGAVIIAAVLVSIGDSSSCTSPLSDNHIRVNTSDHYCFFTSEKIAKKLKIQPTPSEKCHNEIYATHPNHESRLFYYLSEKELTKGTYNLKKLFRKPVYIAYGHACGETNDSFSLPGIVLFLLLIIIYIGWKVYEVIKITLDENKK